MWKKTNTSELKKGDKVRIADDESIKEGIVERTAADRFIFLKSQPEIGIGAYKVERFEKPKSTEDEE